jgi:hypothetical protein
MYKTATFCIFFFALVNCSAQSIINTEKLFKTNEEGLGVSSKLSGNSIQGNASVLFLKYSLNFSYKKDKHYLRLLSGGSNINKDKEMVSNNLFSQLRYNYVFNEKNKLFLFSQLQSNAILLLERRFLAGAGFRRSIVDFHKDSIKSFKIELSAGAMQENELLNRTNLEIGEKYHTNYTRMIFSLVSLFDVKNKFTLVNTTYFQQYLLNLNDFRLLNEFNFMFNINKNLAFSIDLVYRFDSEPPSILSDRDLNTNIGLLFKI